MVNHGQASGLARPGMAFCRASAIANRRAIMPVISWPFVCNDDLLFAPQTKCLANCRAGLSPPKGHVADVGGRSVMPARPFADAAGFLTRRFEHSPYLVGHTAAPSRAARA